MLRKGKATEKMSVRAKLRNSIAAVIAGQIQKMQHAWSQWMGRIYGRLPQKQQILCFIAFMLVSGAGFAWIMYLGIFTPKSAAKVIRVERMSLPLSRMAELDGVDEMMVDRLRRARSYLDSFRRTENGRKWWDGLKIEEKRLVDSLYRLEYLY